MVTRIVSTFGSILAFAAKRKIPVVTALSTASIAALISGGAILSVPLPGGLPLGNLLSIFPFCFPALLAVWLSRPGTSARHFSAASLIAAAAWLPVSIGLARNLNLNFSGIRGEVWVWLSVGTAALAAAALTWATIDCLFNMPRKGERSNAA